MENLLNPPVIWFIAGFILLILELIIPGFVIIFFGVGAWITALVCILFGINIHVQVIIFTISSVILLIVFRKYFKSRFFKENKSISDALEDEFIGKTAVVESEIKKGIPGKISFKGTNWTAISDTTILKGEIVEITGKESINMIVKPTK